MYFHNLKFTMILNLIIKKIFYFIVKRNSFVILNFNVNNDLNIINIIMT